MELKLIAKQNVELNITTKLNLVENNEGVVSKFSED